MAPINNPNTTETVETVETIRSVDKRIDELESELFSLRKRRRTHINAAQNVTSTLHDPAMFVQHVEENTSKFHTSMILHTASYNKDTAFTHQERERLGLRGLLPPRPETMEDQLNRALWQMRSFDVNINKHVFLVQLAERNETLFYRLVVENLKECTPLIYTPTVGEACIKFGSSWRSAKGVYVSVEDKGRVSQILDNYSAVDDIDIIVVSDGSRILGLGDLGTNGMGIPIGKLSLYVAAAGFHPTRTLPILLDTGTNNEALREHPHYLGLRQPRASSEEFFSLTDEFMLAVKQRWPKCIVQFEDFSNNHVFDLLSRNRNKFRCFNDDIQGTGAVILAGYINAVRVSKIPITEHKLLIFGAGSAAVGVADMCVVAFTDAGLTQEEAQSRVYLVDSRGLVTMDRGDTLANHKLTYARKDNAGKQYKDLLDIVKFVQPTTMFGLSGQGSVFTQEICAYMAEINKNPIIFPLSNPTSKAECQFKDCVEWTDGRVIFASGSPFAPVEYKGKTHTAYQGNNMYVFPAIGLASSVCEAKSISEEMIITSARTLAAQVSDEAIAEGQLYPDLGDIRQISLNIAVKIVECAQRQGLAEFEAPSDGNLSKFISNRMYFPRYV